MQMHCSTVQKGLRVWTGTSLTVQWIGLRASTAESTGWMLCQETKILQVVDQKKKKKKSEQFNHRIKTFCTTKETISKVKRQPSEWEKTIANEATDK